MATSANVYYAFIGFCGTFFPSSYEHSFFVTTLLLFFYSRIYRLPFLPRQLNRARLRRSISNLLVAFLSCLRFVQKMFFFSLCKLTISRRRLIGELLNNSRMLSNDGWEEMHVSCLSWTSFHSGWLWKLGQLITCFGSTLRSSFCPSGNWCWWGCSDYLWCNHNESLSTWIIPTPH